MLASLATSRQEGADVATAVATPRAPAPPDHQLPVPLDLLAERAPPSLPPSLLSLTTPHIWATLAPTARQQDGVLQIGTDPAEWWDTWASFRHALRAQTEALAGVQVRPGELRAYREGTVGWAADRPTFRFPDGLEIPVRVAAVLHQEDGGWKLVQSHTSLAARNEDVMGKPLTT